MIDTLLEFDQQLYILINQGLGSSVLDAILIPFRHKLFWIPLYLFILIFISVNFGKKRWLTYLFIALTITCSDTVSSKIIKPSVERIRPCHCPDLNPEIRIPCSQGYSFTSSHATNHFAIGTFLFFLFSFTKWRILFLFWAGLIGIAQIYVGVHYPGDILAGSLIGFLIGSSLFYFYTRGLNRFIKHDTDN
ncbi:MAG: phosphatase PAP2 family protein [Saprospiraceae bacterium]|nr:phosphatase PAP2 family protein [Saprospiraceae bacterium]